MILSYIDEMNGLYDPNATGIPDIILTGGRISNDEVWFADTAPLYSAPRRWWINDEFVDQDVRTVKYKSTEENFRVKIEKDNQFGTRTVVADFYFQRMGEDHGGDGAPGFNDGNNGSSSAGGAWTNNPLVIAQPDWFNPGMSIGESAGLGSSIEPPPEWIYWHDIIISLNDVRVSVNDDRIRILDFGDG